MAQEKIPKVSVCVITYNQEKYIKQCLQSILDQKVDFDFEIIVGDDYSTDGTGAILADFEQRYPQIVRVISQHSNTGGTQNYLDVHNLARGDYVAHCDGDDYSLPSRLRLQADVLDQLPTCSMVYGQAIQIDMDAIEINPRLFLRNPTFFKDQKFTLSDVLRYGTLGAHSSLMYRRKARATVSSQGPLLDYYYALEFLKSGYGCYINQPLVVHRLHVPGSLMSSAPVRDLLIRHMADFLQLYPHHRRDVFLGSLFLLAQDILEGRFRKRVGLYSTIRLTLKSISFVTLKDLWKMIDFVRR
jgi:glycosyltransferase involved in cell wall biosynthesis